MKWIAKPSRLVYELRNETLKILLKKKLSHSNSKKKESVLKKKSTQKMCVLGEDFLLFSLAKIVYIIDILVVVSH